MENKGARRKSPKRSRFMLAANGFMDINNPVVISPPVGIILLRNIVVTYVGFLDWIIACVAVVAIGSKVLALPIHRRTGLGLTLELRGRMLLLCQIITTR